MSKDKLDVDLDETSKDNQRRINQAVAAAKAWLEAGGDNDEDTILVDMVADLCHWDEARGSDRLTTERDVQMGLMHWIEEREQ